MTRKKTNPAAAPRVSLRGGIHPRVTRGPRSFFARDFHDQSSNAQPLRRDGCTVPRAKVRLAPDRHGYRIIVDDDSQNDPHVCPVMRNESGSSNCVFEVDA